MKRRHLEDCLAAHGLVVDHHTGSGDAKVIVEKTGEVVYSRLPFANTDFQAGHLAGIRKGARRVGIEICPYKEAVATDWKGLIREKQKEKAEVRAKEAEGLRQKLAKKKAKRLPIDKPKSKEADWRPVHSMAKEAGIAEEWLKENIEDLLPKGAVLPDGANYEMFFKWFIDNDYRPLKDYLVAAGASPSLAAAWVREGKIDVIPGILDGKRVNLARFSDIEDILRGRVGSPRHVYFGRAAILEALGKLPSPIGLAHKLVPESAGLRRIPVKEQKQILTELNNGVFQRKIMKGHVVHLSREGVMGRLRVGNIAFVKYPNGVLQLVNGQHYLNVGIVLDSELTVTVEVYNVKNAKEANEVFMTFDNRRSVKTLGTHVVGITRTHNVPCSEKRAKLFSQGLVIYDYKLDRNLGEYQGHKGEAIFDDTKAKILTEVAGHWECIRFLESLYSQCDNVGMKKLQIVSSVVWHYYIDHEEAERFWRPILTGIGGFTPRKGKGKDPRKLLYIFLDKARLSQHSRSADLYPESEIFYTIHRYWNMFRANKVSSKVDVAREAVVPI